MVEPLAKEVITQPLFGDFVQIIAPRPNKPPDPIVFISPGRKGPGFV